MTSPGTTKNSVCKTNGNCMMVLLPELGWQMQAVTEDLQQQQQTPP
jgi:hypothetical protein